MCVCDDKTFPLLYIKTIFLLYHTFIVSLSHTQIVYPQFLSSNSAPVTIQVLQSFSSILNLSNVFENLNENIWLVLLKRDSLLESTARVERVEMTRRRTPGTLMWLGRRGESRYGVLDGGCLQECTLALRGFTLDKQLQCINRCLSSTFFLLPFSLIISRTRTNTQTYRRALIPSLSHAVYTRKHMEITHTHMWTHTHTYTHTHARAYHRLQLQLI